MKIDKLASDRNVKLVTHVPETTFDELQLYKSCYADKYGAQISDSKLVGAILQQFMSDDAEFSRWKRQARPATRSTEPRAADKLQADGTASDPVKPAHVVDPGF